MHAPITASLKKFVGNFLMQYVYIVEPHLSVVEGVSASGGRQNFTYGEMGKGLNDLQTPTND